MVTICYVNYHTHGSFNLSKYHTTPVKELQMYILKQIEKGIIYIHSLRSGQVREKLLPTDLKY